MNDVRVVVFDCDGVMFDTEEANRYYYNHILEHFKRPGMTAAQLRFAHTHTLPQALEHLFETEELRRSALEFRRSMDYGRFLKYLTIEPHLVGLLDRIGDRYKTAIATNRTDTMPRLLAEFGLTDRFDLVVTSLDVERAKPFPDALLKILSHFRVQPDQAIFIGDSEVDEGAAHAAGVPFVSYRNPDLAAHWHIESLKDLEERLA